MLNIVLFGAPGSGKGTQSEKIVEKYKLKHISTGDLFRKHLKEGTKLGKLAQTYMNEGNLVPDKVVIGMVEETIDKAGDVKGFIFDGFPRTTEQAESLDKLLESKKIPIKGVIALEVEEKELKQRILLRGKISNRSDDQNEEKINNRLQVYFKETIPVANYYKKYDKLHNVKGIGEIRDIFEGISKVIDNL